MLRQLFPIQQLSKTGMLRFVQDLAMLLKTRFYTVLQVLQLQGEASSIAGSDNQTLTGYNLGAGLEQELLDGITARVEYGFSDYGSETFG